MIDLPESLSQFPTTVKIGGIEYSFATIKDLAEAERIEATKLILRSVPLLRKIAPGEFLNEQEATELDAIYERLVDLFLPSVPAEVRKRLTGLRRISMLMPVWKRAMADQGLFLS